MEKVIRDGEVAILYSPGFGAGWYTWNTEHPELIFHPKLVAMVEEGNRLLITEHWVSANIGIDAVYCGGAEDLTIAWLPQGTPFDILDYDGSESIHTYDDIKLIA